MKQYNKQIELLRHLTMYEGDDLTISRVTNTLYRIGYCCNCGKCCDSLTINSRVSHHSRQLVELHNIKVRMLSPIITTPNEAPTEYTAELTFPVPCKNLKIVDGTCICTDYENRPMICKMYPRDTSLFKECTYTFTDIEKTNWFTEERDKYWEMQDSDVIEIIYET